jgi:hypothetical protein
VIDIIVLLAAGLLAMRVRRSVGIALCLAALTYTVFA